jgi:hypothetical protein
MIKNLYTFPSKFLYWEEIENHKEIKKNILNPILEHSNSLDKLYTNKEHLEYCEDRACKTTYFLEGEQDKFLINLLEQNDHLNSIIWNVIDRLLQNDKLNLNEYPKRSRIDKLWYNVYSKGGHHDMHTHGGHEGFGGIYILDLHEKNTTTFFTPGNRFFEKTYYLDDVKEGTVIIFPTDLIHCVHPSLKNRVTISFNISCSF